MSANEAIPTRKDPVGNLCVIRDESLNSWSVLVCPGRSGARKPLKQFSTRGEAEAFANAEITRLNATVGQTKYVLHVDDCPCWQKEL